jgi:hypothetical protein
MSARTLPWLLPLLLLQLACSGEDTTVGFGEPLRVKDAQFREGALPGLPALTADDINAGVKSTPPSVEAVLLGNNVLASDDPGRTIRGQASADSAAIGVRLADAGSGYWLVPTSSVDPLSPGVVEWSLSAAFDRDLNPGLHRLLFAAIDDRGKSGTQGELNLCITPTLPDNGNACDPTTSPPNLVVDLAWDAPVDLDLRVITPSGKVVDSKHPTTADADEDGKVDPTAEGTGRIDHDAFAHCQAVGRRTENLVFQTNPAPGTYLVYANLYDACGQADVHFDVSLHVAAPGDEEGTFTQKQTFHQAGQLEAVHANGGAKLGMFLTSFVAH